MTGDNNKLRTNALHLTVCGTATGKMETLPSEQKLKLDTNVQEDTGALEAELREAIRLICLNFVDFGFGVHPHQQALEKAARDNNAGNSNKHKN